MITVRKIERCGDIETETHLEVSDATPEERKVLIGEALELCADGGGIELKFPIQRYRCLNTSCEATFSGDPNRYDGARCMVCDGPIVPEEGSGRGKIINTHAIVNQIVGVLASNQAPGALVDEIFNLARDAIKCQTVQHIGPK